MDPEKDINIVVAGEGAQTAAMLRNNQVDALSQFDTQYAMVENAGVKLRMLDTKDIDRYPSNGFLALDETLKTMRRRQWRSAGLCQGHHLRHQQPGGRDPDPLRDLSADQADRQGRGHSRPRRHQGPAGPRRELEARQGGRQEVGGELRGELRAYAEFMLKWGVIKQKVDGHDLITNELIDEINKFDPNKIAAEAKAYKYGK